MIAAALVAVFGTTSAAHAAPTYPSWDDVQAAVGDASAMRAQVAEIQSFIDDLETEATALSVASLEKGEEYNQAREALAKATERSDTLAVQADAASAAATESARQAGQLVAQLARTGSGALPVELFMSGSGADDLLYKLGTVNKLSENSAVVYDRALRERNEAESLTSQAEIALTERAELAATAESVLAEAEAAADAAQSRIAAQAATADQLSAQLNVLTSTVDTTREGYLAGIATEKARLASEQAAAAAAAAAANQPAAPVTPTTPTTPTTPAQPTTPPVVTPVAPPVVTPPVVTPPVVTPPVVSPPPVTVPAPSTSVAAAAIAYAKAQLGEPYQFGGAGPNSWDCSGLTMQSYASVGVYIGTHGVTSQYNTMAAKGRLVPISQVVAGDLLFYANGGTPGGGFYHTAIYIGGGQMIEAPRAGVPVRIVAMRYGDLVPNAGRPTP